MKRAIMGVHHRQGALKNIGDYIQAIAANQFMRTDAYIDREEPSPRQRCWRGARRWKIRTARRRA